MIGCTGQKKVIISKGIRQTGEWSINDHKYVEQADRKWEINNSLSKNSIMTPNTLYAYVQKYKFHYSGVIYLILNLFLILF